MSFRSGHHQAVLAPFWVAPGGYRDPQGGLWDPPGRLLDTLGGVFEDKKRGHQKMFKQKIKYMILANLLLMIVMVMVTTATTAMAMAKAFTTAVGEGLEPES